MVDWLIKTSRTMGCRQELAMSRVEQARRRIEARIYQDAIGESPGAKWKMLLPFFTEQGFAARVIRKRLGMPTPLNTTDRIVMEQVIFPQYTRDPAIGKVLFVGCGTYTVHYQQLYFPNMDFWTIEPDPSAARYGAKQHVIAPLEQLDRHFPPGNFDLIVCNGVYGWGLDRHEQLEAGFAQCHSRLRDDGHLFFGWDDIPQRAPVDLDTVSSRALFRKYTFPPLGTWRYLTDTLYRHTFDFYRK
jgi:SAM-dependent methyltransferase